MRHRIQYSALVSATGKKRDYKRSFVADEYNPLCRGFKDFAWKSHGDLTVVAVMNLILWIPQVSCLYRTMMYRVSDGIVTSTLFRSSASPSIPLSVWSTTSVSVVRMTAAVTGRKKKSLASTYREPPLSRGIGSRRFPSTVGPSFHWQLEQKRSVDVGPGCAAPIRISYSNADSIHAGIMAAVERRRGHGEGEIDRTLVRACSSWQADSHVSAYILWDRTFCSPRALWEPGSLAPASGRGASTTPVALTRKRKYTSIFLLYPPLLCHPLPLNSPLAATIACRRILYARNTPRPFSRLYSILGCRADGGSVCFAYWTIVHMSWTILSRVA